MKQQRVIKVSVPFVLGRNRIVPGRSTRQCETSLKRDHVERSQVQFGI